MSELQRQRTAEANRRRVVTPEYRERLRNAHLGQVAWNKGITGDRSHSFGRKRTEDQKRLIRERTSGERSHWWKGGKTEEARRFKATVAYKNWRKAVFERDDYTCVLCGKRGGELHPDHIKPFSLFPDLRLEISNGRTLCAPCHRETPTYGSKIRKYVHD